MMAVGHHVRTHTIRVTNCHAQSMTGLYKVAALPRKPSVYFIHMRILNLLLSSSAAGFGSFAFLIVIHGIYTYSIFHNFNILQRVTCRPVGLAYVVSVTVKF